MLARPAALAIVVAFFAAFARALRPARPSPALPPGWRRMPERRVTAELRRRAQEILVSDLHLGSVVELDARHAAIVELHRNGTEHRGVSLLERIP